MDRPSVLRSLRHRYPPLRPTDRLGSNGPAARLSDLSPSDLRMDWGAVFSESCHRLDAITPPAVSYYVGWERGSIPEELRYDRMKTGPCSYWAAEPTWQSQFGTISSPQLPFVAAPFASSRVAIVGESQQPQLQDLSAAPAPAKAICPPPSGPPPSECASGEGEAEGRGEAKKTKA
jgi:hypothetical protein